MKIEIEIDIRCPLCGSHNIDIGKIKGFCDTALNFIESNYCNMCLFTFDLDIGMVAYSLLIDKYPSSYLNYESLNFSHTSQTKVWDK